jgi:hypothetical protein
MSAQNGVQHTVKPETEVRAVIQTALTQHFAATGHTPQFRERWTYRAESASVEVEVVGESRFDGAYCRYVGPLGVWIVNLRHGAISGKPKRAA